MTDLLLAHLSDPHLGAPPPMRSGERNLKRAFGWINWRRRSSMHLASAADLILADIADQRPEHIAFTGDYANIGLGAEVADGARWIARLGPPDRVSVVPGNHDIYSRRGIGPDLGMAPWSRHMTSQPIDGPAPVLPLDGFPFVRRLGRVALIGVNSAIPTPVFLAWGEVGERQLQRLDRLLGSLGAEGLVRVVMIHHPPLPGLTKPLRHLRDAPALAELLTRRGAELVLYGHNHRDTTTWHPGPEAAIPVIGVASASLAEPNGHQPRARYNLFRINASSGARPEIEIEQRGLMAADGPVTSLARMSLIPPQVA